MVKRITLRNVLIPTAVSTDTYTLHFFLLDQKPRKKIGNREAQLISKTTVVIEIVGEKNQGLIVSSALRWSTPLIK